MRSIQAGDRWGLGPAFRRSLRARPRSQLSRLAGDRGFVLAAAAALLAGGTVCGSPPGNLSDVVAGNHGFVMNGIDQNDQSGLGVSGAGDVNGDGLADLIVGARFADPGGAGNGGEI